MSRILVANRSSESQNVEFISTTALIFVGRFIRILQRSGPKGGEDKTL